MAKRRIIRHPEVEQEWKNNLRNFSLKCGFHLSLTRAMLEFLCATADDVQWDRALYHNLCIPENRIASERSLEKRGLIERKPPSYFEQHKHDDRPRQNHANCILTPAGKLVVDLVKMAGVFVEADAAIEKRTRRA